MMIRPVPAHSGLDTLKVRIYAKIWPKGPLETAEEAQ